jgi:hypothetical protein
MVQSDVHVPPLASQLARASSIASSLNPNPVTRSLAEEDIGWSPCRRAFDVVCASRTV